MNTRDFHIKAVYSVAAAERRAKAAIARIARDKGMSEAEVRREMELAIAEGMKSTDPDVIAQWKVIPHKGDMPTPDELIAYMATKLK